MASAEPHSGATDLFTRERAALLADASLTGTALCGALTATADRWLAALLDAAAASNRGRRLALVAVGGYGRGELSPGSDLDVVLLHEGRPDGTVAAAAEAIWYPVWDQGLKLGHAVRTVKDSLGLAADDLETATSFLSCRHLAGDESMSTALADGALAQWRARAARWLMALGRSVEARHDVAGEVAFLLEPNLKDGRGGLRDVHALTWADLARPVLTDLDRRGLVEAYETLLSVRVELHRTTGRNRDLLVLQEQDAVATALDDGDADALMARVSAAARSISWPSDEVWRRVNASMKGGRSRQDRVLSDTVVLLDGEVHVRRADDAHRDPELVLEAAAAAATHGTAIDQPSLHHLVAGTARLPEPWPASAHDRFASLLLAGRPAVPVIEALDRMGLWERLVPEWTTVRCKPQRNAYHRFTVDRHLVETAVGAAALTDCVERPDLLVVGALLHDLGKGYPGDHTVVGCDLARQVGGRMGFDPADVEDLVAMVEHHLLLPDVASRRDLGDPATISSTAAAVKTARRLHLLAALTEADSLATGSSAWSTWKAGLVAQLVTRVDEVLRGAAASDVVGGSAPPAMVRPGPGEEAAVLLDGDELTVVGPDDPGSFSRVAGVLALHGLDVRAAQAWSEGDLGASRFHVDHRGRPPDPDRLTMDIRLALRGRLALEARLAERAEAYAPRRPAAATTLPATAVVDNEASETATVIDVQAADSLGLLYHVTRALSDLGLDLRTALVQTLGPRVADAFYVTDGDGRKITDPQHRREIERAVVFACGGR